MKRMKLKLETLRVASFEPGRCPALQRGTVRAMEPENQNCPPGDTTGPTYPSDWWCGVYPTYTGCVEYTGEIYYITPLC